MLFFILDYFLSFYSPNSPKNQNLKKMEKAPGNIIILHKCNKNNDQMQYCSWDMVRDRCNCYFSFWAIFCPFTPRTTWQMKILKKWKKPLEISSFYISVPKIMIICYTVTEIRSMTNVIITFSFWTIFCLFTPLTTGQMKIF